MINKSTAFTLLNSYRKTPRHQKKTPKKPIDFNIKFCQRKQMKVKLGKHYAFAQLQINHYNLEQWLACLPYLNS